MIRCQNCQKALAEFLEGRAAIRCSRCKLVNIVTSSQETVVTLDKTEAEVKR